MSNSTDTGRQRRDMNVKSVESVLCAPKPQTKQLFNMAIETQTLDHGQVLEIHFCVNKSW